MPEITGAHHLALTVSNADQSATWYCDLFGFAIVLSGDDDDVSFRVLAHPSGWFMGVRQYHKHPADRFDEFRTGLDHLALTVASRAELDAWETELTSRSIGSSPTAETPIGSVVVLRDPDNIQVELWLPAA